MLFSSLLITEASLFIIGKSLWWLFFFGNLYLICYYIGQFVFPFSWTRVFPSWSVLFVGIAMAALTAPASQEFKLGQGIFGICLILTFIILPIMSIKTYRIGLVDSVMSNISTFCAPLSLLSVAYLSTFETPNKLMVLALLLGSQALYAFVLVQLPRLINRPFNPGFAAFTFPFVISAISFKKSLSFLGITGIWNLIVAFEIILSFALVSYVLIWYVYFLAGKDIELVLFKKTKP
ncbi:C4-dicarboxylate transporter/malic acid transport protein [Streptococcus ictaluri 707-05]|uniref:C4-dicarboxylate transporter/malic acid transport protein n=1 Tax=Streptococcus ictaluri 707-05 TaxID=764299 RepID=G5K692_9STRE|nr:C4-dicarboxylate transporter/malic acid transport protein [Streptococcus ictaluri 707-05]